MRRCCRNFREAKWGHAGLAQATESHPKEHYAMSEWLDQRVPNRLSIIRLSFGFALSAYPSAWRYPLIAMYLGKRPSTLSLLST